MMSFPIICLLGPTASGKSDAAIQLAKLLPIEIISVDSTLIYKGMDIGTAKPTVDARKKIKHHLIDIIKTTEQYSAACFAHDAKQACKEIIARKHIPLLVGGTMLYYNAFVNPLAKLPSSNQMIRANLEQEAIKLGWPTLHKRLALIDPISAARIAPKDSQRIQRALEIFELTGETLSEHLIKAQANASKKENQLANIFTISLIPSDRTIIHSKIAMRFDQMLSNGFLEEVMCLRKDPALTIQMPSMRSVGYRQAWNYLDQKLTMSEFRDQVLIATRQLCKRQLTWLRKIESNYTLDSFSEKIPQKLFELFKKHINSHMA